jgi:hypothetical protein
MHLGPHLLYGSPPRAQFPSRRWAILRGTRVCVKRDRRELLQESNEHERHFIVCELKSSSGGRITKTNRFGDEEALNLLS